MKQDERKVLEDTVFQLMNALRERTHKKYVAGYGPYRKRVETACRAEQEYRAMGLEEDRRKVMDHVLETRSEVEDCELTLTYVAGILDSLLILRAAGFLDLYMREDEEPFSA